MRDSQIDPEEIKEIPYGMTDIEYQEAVEQYDIDRQMEKYNL